MGKLTYVLLHETGQVKTIGEMAQMLGVSERTIYRKIKNGEMQKMSDSSMSDILKQKKTNRSKNTSPNDQNMSDIITRMGQMEDRLFSLSRRAFVEPQELIAVQTELHSRMLDLQEQITFLLKIVSIYSEVPSDLKKLSKTHGRNAFTIKNTRGKQGEGKS